MSAWLLIPGGLLLFGVGLRLSAFFSGSETGFYRMSLPRLQSRSEQGDRSAARLLSFSEDAPLFVATTLVGNNVANYLTTAAVGLFAAAFALHGAVAEVGLTLLVSPVIFVFGELLPKSIYYRAPLSRMTHDAKYHLLAMRLFLPVSFPLVGIARFLERKEPEEIGLVFESVLGHGRIVRLFSHCEREGFLSAGNAGLVRAALRISRRFALQTAIRVEEHLGLPEQSTRQEILDHAARHGLSDVALYRGDPLEEWAGSVTVAELALSRKSVRDAMRPMPDMPASVTTLDALLQISEVDGEYGVIRDELGAVVALANRDRLLRLVFEAFDQSPEAAG